MVLKIIFVLIDQELVILLLLKLMIVILLDRLLSFAWQLQASLRQGLAKFSLIVISHVARLLVHSSILILVDSFCYLLDLLCQDLALICIHSIGL